jgi:hypothetical protein
MFPSVSVELYLASNKQRGKSKRMKESWILRYMFGRKQKPQSVCSALTSNVGIHFDCWVSSMSFLATTHELELQTAPFIQLVDEVVAREEEEEEPPISTAAKTIGYDG